MARFLSSTLVRTLSSSSNPLQTFKLGVCQLNRFSSLSGNSQLIDFELESGGEAEVLGFRKLEDKIQNIVVRQSAPDFLPFVPGSSYWIPPHRNRSESHDLFEILKKLTDPLIEDESMSLSTSNGWPSSVYFTEDTFPLHSVEVKADSYLIDEE